MKKSLITLVFLALVSMVWAQTTPPNLPQNQTPTPAPTQAAPAPPGATGDEANPVMQNLGWMIGTWQGTGSQNGQTFESTLNIRPQLDGQALLIERSSPTGYKEIMVIAYDKTARKVVSTIFTSQNNSGIFIGNIAGDQVTFSQVSSAAGSSSERVYQKDPAGSLQMTIRGADSSGQPKTLLEMTFTKQS